MTIAPPLDIHYTTAVALQAEDTHQALIKGLVAQAAAQGVQGLPFYRMRKVAAQVDPARLLERYAGLPGMQILRPGPVTVIARTGNIYAHIVATGTPKHCTMSFRLWAQTPELADAMVTRLLEEVSAFLIRDVLFSLEWRFNTSRGLSKVATVERPTDVLLDEAYPTLPGGVTGFIDRYLDARESVLVLQGPPGTGKTRLVRELLRRMSIRKTATQGEWDDGCASALYSGDGSVWESDEIFTEFITGEHDAFLIEDADHLVKPRADGNDMLHRFLNVSDGIAQAQGRKIIFSTNLPNVRDLDDALVRPGRCFAHVQTRAHQRDESQRLLVRLCVGDTGRLEASGGLLDAAQKKIFTVAEIYAAHRAAGGTSGVEVPRRTGKEG